MAGKKHNENDEEQAGFWSNRHKWPTWKWVLLGIGIFVLLSAVIVASILTFGGAGVAIAAGIGGASFAGSMSAAWATCFAVLTNATVMSIIAAANFFLGSSLLFVLKNDKPLVMNSSKTSSVKQVPGSDSSGAARIQQGLKLNPTVVKEKEERKTDPHVDVQAGAGFQASLSEDPLRQKKNV